MGAFVTGVSLSPNTKPSLFHLLEGERLCDSRILNLKDLDNIKEVVKSCQPEIVIHLAAQALVRTSYLQPVDTFTTNILGTVNLFEALRTEYSPKVVIAVTTDKVYQNREWIFPYRENDRLGGHDPYSASKAACEIAIQCYIKSFLTSRGTAVGIARAGNVIGGGDWSLDRLIPDAVRAWSNNATLEIRRPQSIRPWQHVLEPINAYLVLAEKLWHAPELAQAYNFGPPPDQTASVREVVEFAREVFGRGKTIYSDSQNGPHEAEILVLDNSKARSLLGIEPRWSLKMALTRTMKWYQDFDRGADPSHLCHADLSAYKAINESISSN